MRLVIVTAAVLAACSPEIDLDSAVYCDAGAICGSLPFVLAKERQYLDSLCNTPLELRFPRGVILDDADPGLYIYTSLGWAFCPHESRNGVLVHDRSFITMGPEQE